MDFELLFIRIFLDSLWFMAPLIGSMTLAILGLGVWVGRLEGWTFEDSAYYAFITATTVGYGDRHPTERASKFIAVLIALTGLLLTGIVVSLALNAATFAFEATHDIDSLRSRYGIEAAKP